MTTFVCGILALVTSLVISPAVGRIFAVMWARLNSFFTPMTVNVIGAENMEPDASYVIIANHQSLYDIYALYGWLGRDFKWVMKKELELVPVLGIACKALGHIFIDRADSRAAVDTINAAKEKIRNGTSVFFFPEGSRSSDGKVGPFKKGAFKMAIDLGLPVLPVTLNGTRDILPKGGADLMPGAVTMIIHKPVSVKNYHEKNLKKLMDKTRISIISALE
jgi:1-acyl-sn-glycerol-3-phosphate acyltransferase